LVLPVVREYMIVKKGFTSHGRYSGRREGRRGR
jgi:hypothetical protein